METWLHDMDNRPLPGGVTAAAVAAAMGAALIAKVLRVTLERKGLSAEARVPLETALGEARAQRAELLRLAKADMGAYHAVLKAHSLPAHDPARNQAWRAATEVPLRVAELCHSLLDRARSFCGVCWSSVCVDLEIGSSLLEGGMRAGMQAAEANLRAWGPGADSGSLQAILKALRE